MDYDNNDGFFERTTKARFLYGGIIILIFLLLLGVCVFAAEASDFHPIPYYDANCSCWINKQTEEDPNYSVYDDPNLLADIYESIDLLEDLNDRLATENNIKDNQGCFIESL